MTCKRHKPVLYSVDNTGSHTCKAAGGQHERIAHLLISATIDDQMYDNIIVDAVR